MYFLYPETANVRLEDMNALFGDATTAMPTPDTQAERGSLMGVGSPGSIDIRQGASANFGAESAIPGLDINPPDVEVGENGKPIYGESGMRGRGSMSEGRPGGDGLGGWIGRIVSRSRQRSQSTQGGGGRGGYGRVGQDED